MSTAVPAPGADADAASRAAAGQQVEHAVQDIERRIRATTPDASADAIHAWTAGNPVIARAIHTPSEHGYAQADRGDAGRNEQPWHENGHAYGHEHGYAHADRSNA